MEPNAEVPEVPEVNVTEPDVPEVNVTADVPEQNLKFLKLM